LSVNLAVMQNMQTLLCAIFHLFSDHSGSNLSDQLMEP
jgi:hypothetical protein